MKIFFPDPAFRQYVLDTIDENGSGALEDFEREKVTTIDLNNGYNGSKISDLTGIEYFYINYRARCIQ